MEKQYKYLWMVSQKIHALRDAAFGADCLRCLLSRESPNSEFSA